MKLSKDQGMDAVLKVLHASTDQAEYVVYLHMIFLKLHLSLIWGKLHVGKELYRYIDQFFNKFVVKHKPGHHPQHPPDKMENWFVSDETLDDWEIDYSHIEYEFFDEVKTSTGIIPKGGLGEKEIHPDDG